jgi:DNA-binding transcriptional LysR family regulator
MDLRTLRAFVEVVRQGGFSAAATVINATQPTVSKAVRQLEDEVGGALLDRLGHRVQLTAMGELVYRRALAMLAERDSLISELADLRGLQRGRLRLGLPQLGSSILFAPLVARYRALYPGIDIDLVEQGSNRLKQAVMAGELELGAALAPIEDDFATQPVRDEPLVVVMPADHQLAQRGRLKLAELAESGFILFEAGFTLNEMIRAACQRRGFQPREVAHSAQPDFILALVAAGLGVAFLPRLVAERQVKAPLTAILLDENDLRWDLSLIWRAGSILSPAAKAWIDLVAGQELGAPHRNTNR